MSRSGASGSVEHRSAKSRARQSGQAIATVRVAPAEIETKSVKVGATQADIGEEGMVEPTTVKAGAAPSPVKASATRVNRTKATTSKVNTVKKVAENIEEKPPRAKAKKAEPVEEIDAVAKPKRAPTKVAKPEALTTEAAPRSTGQGFPVKTLDRLRRLLEEDRETYMRQAHDLAAEAEALASERESGDTQFDEESGEGDTLNVERERDLALSASAQQAVEEIERALTRMEAGTYGICERCGKKISVARLEALPFAALCIDCKSREERRR